MFEIGVIILGAVALLLWNRMKVLDYRLGETEARLDRALVAASAGRPAMRDIPAGPARDTAPPSAVPPAAPSVPSAATEPPAREPSAPPPQAVAPAQRPVARPATAPAPAPATKRARPAINFEELFGRLLPIWAGGITLAVAGFFLVRYSIDAGLLTPTLRIMCGLIFGSGLIAAAEVAYRREERVRDPRVRQALSGAGLATLYASILIAGNMYGLIGGLTALLGLAAVTAGALVLSLRFGMPSAILGLVGGLAAPALAGSADPNIPLLSVYLALTVGGLSAVAARQRWAWLGIASLVGGFGWGAVLLIGSLTGTGDVLSVGIYLLLLGVAVPFLTERMRAPTLLRPAAAAMATVQISALLSLGGFTMLTWGLYVLLAAAILWLARRHTAMALAPAIGTVLSLAMLAQWMDAPGGQFALVGAALLALFAGDALQKAWKTDLPLITALQLCGASLGALAVTAFHFHDFADAVSVPFAALAAGLSVLPAWAAWRGWPKDARHADFRFTLFVTTAAVLFAFALGFLLPHAITGPAVALIAAALITGRDAARDARLQVSAGGFLAAGVALLMASHGFADELLRLFGERGAGTVFASFACWAVVAASASWLAYKAEGLWPRTGVGILAALLAYGAAAQLVPVPFLPLVPAAMLAGSAWARSVHVAAPGTALALALLWAIEPLVIWTGGALAAAAGIGMQVSDVPALSDIALRIVIPALAGGYAALRYRTILRRHGAWLPVAGTLGLLGLVAVHSAYKHVFALEDGNFMQMALAERTIWQGLLLAAAFAAYKWRDRAIFGLQLPALTAPLLAAAALTHGIWFSMIMNSPLVGDVQVGALPVLNLLLPSFGIALLAVWLLRRTSPDEALWRRGLDVVAMAVITLFAATELRQLFAGTLLNREPVGALEDIGYSILGILLAVGFLLWGARRGLRTWRIGSLVLILLAVLKVFLLDASGLDGLLRIASFALLGFSLIGIGWFYSRQLQSASAGKI